MDAMSIKPVPAGPLPARKLVATELAELGVDNFQPNPELCADAPPRGHEVVKPCTRLCEPQTAAFIAGRNEPCALHIVAGLLDFLLNRAAVDLARPLAMQLRNAVGGSRPQTLEDTGTWHNIRSTHHPHLPIQADARLHPTRVQLLKNYCPAAESYFCYLCWRARKDCGQKTKKWNS